MKILVGAGVSEPWSWLNVGTSVAVANGFQGNSGREGVQFGK